MKKAIPYLLLACALLLAGRFWQEVHVNAQGAGQAAACKANRSLHSIDANGDGGVDISDAIHLLNWLFVGGPEPKVCLAQVDGSDLEPRVKALEEMVQALGAKTALSDLRCGLGQVATWDGNKWTCGPGLTQEQKDILSYLSLSEPPRTIRFSGVNVQIVNGTGNTDKKNSLGNLIVGYQEQRSTPEPNDRTGSHNIVVGREQNYSSYGGLLAGEHNTLSGVFCSVVGGRSNTAAGAWSSVSGGEENQASTRAGSVSGGFRNAASGARASVSGGCCNDASGTASSIGGGTENKASGSGSAVTGGSSNVASGESSAVSGGSGNTASGKLSSVSGGAGNLAEGWASSVSGGAFNHPEGSQSSVSGGLRNRATGDLSAVVGGGDNVASGVASAVSGGLDNVASGNASAVSGGQNNEARGEASTVSGGGSATEGRLAGLDYSTVSGTKIKWTTTTETLNVTNRRAAILEIDAGTDHRIVTTGWRSKSSNQDPAHQVQLFLDDSPTHHSWQLGINHTGPSFPITLDSLDIEVTARAYSEYIGLVRSGAP